MRTKSFHSRGVLSDGFALLLVGSAIVAAVIFFVYILVYDEEDNDRHRYRARLGRIVRRGTSCVGRYSRAETVLE